MMRKLFYHFFQNSLSCASRSASGAEVKSTNEAEYGGSSDGRRWFQAKKHGSNPRTTRVCNVYNKQ
jgi:hypothetical protein